MSYKKLMRTYGAAAFVISLVLASPSAHAGFEWVSPENAAPPLNAQPTMAPAPYVSTAMPEVISPVIISGSAQQQPQPGRNAPTYPAISSYAPPAAPAAPAAMADAAPMPIVQPSAAPNLATATISMAPPPAAGDVVQGFASQVPLALALRQILPAGTNFSIDQDISMDALVSYRGGKPWPDTLRDMLAPMGLVARQQGSTITISHVTAAPMPALTNASPTAPVVVSMAPAPAQNVAPATAYMAPNADAPSVNVSAPDGWSAQRGDTLRKVLTDWCRRQNVELQWQAEYDYPVEASAHFNGSFEDAVRSLLVGFDEARPQPIGELHNNSSAGQMVLVVQARGNSYTN